MEESTCHAMIIHLSQRFSSVLWPCYVFVCFLHFLISFKYDVHVDPERTIVKTQKCKEISASVVLKK